MIINDVQNFYVLTTSSPDENLRVTQKRLGLTTLILEAFCGDAIALNLMLLIKC
jgi:hypothetical protein